MIGLVLMNLLGFFFRIPRFSWARCDRFRKYAWKLDRSMELILRDEVIEVFHLLRWLEDSISGGFALVISICWGMAWLYRRRKCRVEWLEKRGGNAADRSAHCLRPLLFQYRLPTNIGFFPLLCMIICIWILEVFSLCSFYRVGIGGRGETLSQR